MRLVPLITAGLVIAGSASVRAADNDPLFFKTHVGTQLMLKLPGNPKAGYKWKLSPQKSTGLALVEVDFIGWLMAPGRRSVYFRKNSIQNINIVAKAEGEAILAFEYYRTWGNRAKLRTRMVTVTIKPAKTAQK